MRIRRALLVALGVVALSATAPVAQAAGEPADYLVTLADRATDPAALAAGHGAQVGHVYRHALSGFSASLSPTAVAALRRDPRVRSVEPDAGVGGTPPTQATPGERAGA
ncbi:protease inhibitor I9 family protein, partial [Crossiella sp. NPDC003009]